MRKIPLAVCLLLLILIYLQPLTATNIGNIDSITLSNTLDAGESGSVNAGEKAGGEKEDETEPDCDQSATKSRSSLLPSSN